MSEATLVRSRDDVRLTADAAVASGEVYQMRDGRAGYYPGLNAAASGDRIGFTTTNQVTLPKTTSMVLLDGGRAYWDHSANAVSYKKVNDRDFYLGRVVGDAASADTTCVVNLNVNPPADIDMLRDGVLSVATGTQALGGFLPPQVYGNARALTLTATNEAQCVDMLSVDRVALGSNPIAEFVIRPAANGSTNAVDANFGLANGTSTTDAEAVTEHVFFHIDGNSTAINAQSKDGTTTVVATDTTKTISVGSAVANRTEFWIDARDPANVCLYVDGVRVLSATTFVLSAAAGPLGLLAHLEKSSSTATAGPFYVDRAELRLGQQ